MCSRLETRLDSIASLRSRCRVNPSRVDPASMIRDSRGATASVRRRSHKEPDLVTRPMRALLLTFPGIAFLAYWVIADPGYEASAGQTTWPHVLGFSAALATLAVALPVFGGQVTGSSARRWSAVAGAAVGANSITNILEDGLGVEWMFMVFVAGTAVMIIGLAGLAAVIARAREPRTRVLALIPMGTIVATVAFVAAGGPIMAASWLGAAAATLWSTPR